MCKNERDFIPCEALLLYFGLTIQRLQLRTLFLPLNIHTIILIDKKYSR